MQVIIFICKDVDGNRSCTTCPALRSCHGTGFDAPKNPVPVISLRVAYVTRRKLVITQASATRESLNSEPSALHQLPNSASIHTQRPTFDFDT